MYEVIILRKYGYFSATYVSNSIQTNRPIWQLIPMYSISIQINMVIESITSYVSQFHRNEHAQLHTNKQAYLNQ